MIGSKYPPPVLDCGQDFRPEAVGHPFPLGRVLQERADFAQEDVGVLDSAEPGGEVVVVVPDDAQIRPGLLGRMGQQAGAAEQIHDRGDAGEAADGIGKTASEVFLLAEKREWSGGVVHALGLLSFTWSRETDRMVFAFVRTSFRSFLLW